MAIVTQTLVHDDFEDGTTQGWVAQNPTITTVGNTTNTPFEGLRSLYMTRTSSVTHRLRRTLTDLEVGVEYTLRAMYLRAVGGTSTGFVFGIDGISTPGLSFPEAGVWTEAVYTFIATATTHVAVYGASILNSGAIVQLDDFRVEQDVEVPDPEPLEGKAVFTSSGVFTPPAGVTSVDVLVVGGGGAGGAAGSRGGGGGGGRVRWETGVPVTPGTPVTVTVGAGGAQSTTGPMFGANGQSSFFGAVEAQGGGGGGGGGSNKGQDGASGGGGGGTADALAYGLGQFGGRGGWGVSSTALEGVGGGGGAGGEGQDGSDVFAGAGGPGLNMSAYVGNELGVGGWFGGGGGGGSLGQQSAGRGFGKHGGGDGGVGLGSGPHLFDSTPGLPNTGGGGGGSAASPAPNRIGGAGGSGIVVVVYTQAAPDQKLPGVSGSLLTNPSNRWLKGVDRATWFYGTWGAIIPTALGHCLIPDLSNPTNLGPVVDNRQSSRVSAILQGTTLHTLAMHATTTHYRAYDMNDSYALIRGPIAVPLTTPDVDASPISMFVSRDGSIWAAVVTGGAVRVTRSTNGGVSWTAAVSLITVAETGAVGFEQSGDTVVLVVNLNEGMGIHVRTISQGSSSISSGSWSTETMPSLPSGVGSDDHLSLATDVYGDMWAAMKTTPNATQPLLIVMKRTSNGVWSSVGTIEFGPDNDGWTRPALTISGERLIVTYSTTVSGPAPGVYVSTASIEDPSVWTPRVKIMELPNPDGPTIPPRQSVEAGYPSIPVLAMNRSTGDILLAQINTVDWPALQPYRWFRKGGAPLEVYLKTLTGLVKID